MENTNFINKGVLTPEEFVKAGDYLIKNSPEWNWGIGNPDYNKEYLPNKKQFLIIKNIPCYQRVKDNFNNYKEKLEVIFAHKLKKNIEAQEADIKARIDEAVASREEGDDPEEEATEEEESEGELEVEGDEAEASIPNNNAEASEQISLVEKLKKNFSVEVSN